MGCNPTGAAPGRPSAGAGPGKSGPVLTGVAGRHTLGSSPGVSLGPGGNGGGMRRHRGGEVRVSRFRIRGRLAAAAAGLALALVLGTGEPARADISGVVYYSGTGHYYKWVASNGGWTAAKAGAEAMGGYLATVTSDAERTWLDSYIRPANTTCCIGGTDESVEGTWTWLTGESWSYTYWNGGEPNNSGNEDYVMVNNNGTWNDIPGNYNLSGYIVEWDVNPNIPPPPAAPTGLTAEFSGSGTVLLAWTDNSVNEDNFEVYRRTTSGSFTRIASPAAGSTTHEDASSMGPSTTFTYKVRAVNLGGPSAYTNDAAVTTADAPLPPAAPTDLLVTEAGPYSITFQWTDNSDDEVMFEIYRRTPTGTFQIIDIASPDDTSYSDAGLTADTAYCFGVRAVNIHGPSATAEFQTSTIATLDVTTVRADLTDSPKMSKDKIKVTAQYEFLPSASGDGADPVADGLRVRAGPEENPVTLLIPAADAGWKVRKGKAKWKSPKGTVSKYSVMADLETRTLTVSVSGIQLAAPAANPMRVSVAIGDEGGSTGGDWLEKKPGKFRMR